MWLIWFLPPPSRLYHQVGRKKAKKPQTLKLGSEKALVIPDLQEVSLTPGIGTHTGTVLSSTRWSSPVPPQCVCVCVGHCWTASDSGQQRAMCALSVYPYVHTYTPDTRFSISFLYLKKGKGRWRARRGEVCLSGLLFVTLLTESLFSKGILSFHFLFWMSIHWWVTTVSSLCLCVLQIMRRRLQN